MKRKHVKAMALLTAGAMALLATGCGDAQGSESAPEPKQEETGGEAEKRKGRPMPRRKRLSPRSPGTTRRRPIHSLWQSPLRLRPCRRISAETRPSGRMSSMKSTPM